jgi:hypothetical protein
LNGEFAPRLKVAGSKTEDDVLREAIDTLEKRQRGLCELQEKVREAEADIAAGRRWPFDADENQECSQETTGRTWNPELIPVARRRTLIPAFACRLARQESKIRQLKTTISISLLFAFCSPRHNFN